MATQENTTLRSGAFRQSLIISGVFSLALLLIDVLFFPLDTAAVVVMSGLYQGMLFFLVASGMSIVFGLMDVLNFAQGAFFMLGAYTGFAVYGALPEGTPIWVRFIAALIGAVLAGAP